MRTGVIAAAVLLILVLVSVWIAAAHKYSPTHTVAAVTQQTTATSTPGSVQGSIEVLNGNGFTLTMVNGDTQDVIITATTTILQSVGNKISTTTSDQLNVGQQVEVQGSPDPDGSVTASKVLVQ